jgi:hypothetical protein
MREMDQSLEASRNVFRDFNARFQQISEEDWEAIQLKVTLNLCYEAFKVTFMFYFLLEKTILCFSK